MNVIENRQRINLEHFAEVDDKAKIKLLNPTLFEKHLRSLIGKFITITIEVTRSIRTNKQNRYYWGVVIYLISLAMRELGNDYEPEDIHHFFAQKFLKPQKIQFINIETGEVDVLNQYPSTKKLKTVAFNDYIEQIKSWSSEVLLLEIPEPAFGKRKEDLQEYFIQKFEPNRVLLRVNQAA